MNWTPPPRARLLACGLAIAGTLITRNPILLASALPCLFVWLVCVGLGRSFLRILTVVWLPIAVSLIVVWGGIVGAAPNEPLGSNRLAGVLYALSTILRLVLMGGILQLTWASIHPLAIPWTLSRCGLRGDTLTIVISTYILLPELSMRAEQVLTARRARGLGATSLFGKLRELPILLRPLFAWALRSAIQRSENWNQRQLTTLSQDPIQMPNESVLAGSLFIFLAAAWFVTSLLWGRTM